MLKGAQNPNFAIAAEEYAKLPARVDWHRLKLSESIWQLVDNESDK
jgi:hypothetical protein